MKFGSTFATAMPVSRVLTALILGIVALSVLVPGGIAWAGDATPPREEAAGLDQQAIYAILCGGLTVTDDSLSAHLWSLAGRLAGTQSWIPPRVTVRVLVSETASR
ncbi:MAG: hypothetical protein DHS20C21_20130 [Gemmatimonadota bacterium]|nr:MAG: hypothetical protein DHS20C21_20130 [Gemmatimonadota bacterium]